MDVNASDWDLRREEKVSGLVVVVVVGGADPEAEEWICMRGGAREGRERSGFISLLRGELAARGSY